MGAFSFARSTRPRASTPRDSPAPLATHMERLPELMPRRDPATVLENLSTAVLLFDAALTLEDMNPAAEMLLDLSARQTRGKSLEQLLIGGDGLLARLRASLADSHPFSADHVELALYTGRRLTVDARVTPLGEEGGASGLLVELNQVDRRLRLAREERMSGQHAAHRAVLRGLAHEIKNPLGGLRGAAQLLERNLPDRRLREYTRIIIHEADRLTKLVDRMIGPARPLAPVPYNIHQALEHAAKLITVEYPATLTLKRDYDPSLPEIQADGERLTQALLNLARNAAQAVGGRGEVTLRTRAERKFTIRGRFHRLVVRVDVVDNGPGVDEALGERIFYPMVTSKPEGTGLGLSIAQEVIQQHEGLITWRSVPGETVFSVYLPVGDGHGE